MAWKRRSSCDRISCSAALALIYPSIGVAIVSDRFCARELLGEQRRGLPGVNAGKRDGGAARQLVQAATMSRRAGKQQRAGEQLGLQLLSLPEVEAVAHVQVVAAVQQVVAQAMPLQPTDPVARKVGANA